MVRNEGSTDRTFRLAIGIALLLASIAFQSFLLALPALILLVTGAIGICPLYKLIRIDTFKRQLAADGE